MRECFFAADVGSVYWEDYGKYNRNPDKVRWNIESEFQYNADIGKETGNNNYNNGFPVNDVKKMFHGLPFNYNQK